MRRAVLAALLLLLAWLVVPAPEHRDGWIIGPGIACRAEPPYGCVR